MPEIAFYQDRFIEVDEPVIPIQERGHQFGDGIYEVIRVYNGVPFTMREHMERMEESAGLIRMELPYPAQEIERLALEALRRSDLLEAEIYVQITRGIHIRQHHFPEPAASALSIIIKDARIVPEDKRMSGVDVITRDDVRWKLCYVKSLNLLPNVMAKQEAVEAGAQEALFVDNNVVKEGSSSNVFIVKDGIVKTHPATKGILHGITRRVVIDTAREAGIPLEETRFTKEELYEADEAFLTSTTMELLSIRQVDHHLLPESRPVTDRLFAAFQEKKEKERSSWHKTR
jgi:D-alanine transaminase